MPCGRYAPSPTGAQHLGNLRTALLAWLQARLSGGRFFIRIDDLDTPRNQPGADQRILEDLTWLGMDYDDVSYQSARTDRYDFYFNQLQSDGRLYPCKCSRKGYCGSR